MACEKCQSFQKSILSASDVDIELGSYSDIQSRSSSCHTCHQISELPKILPHGSSPDDVLVSVCGIIKPIKIIVRKRHGQEIVNGFDFFASSNGTEDGTEFHVHAKWIDTGNIQKWLNECNKNHSHRCHPALPWKAEQDLRNLILLDVDRECLTLLPATTKYFALSYVWGDLADIAETTTETLSQFQEPGTLSPDTHMLNLPHTIRDAIRLLRRLGERYLWVDRLCIIQDDEKSKQVHISRMDLIYRHAYCTIAATDGDNADYGLPGVGLGSLLWLCRLDFPEVSLLHYRNSSRWKWSRYNSRGWTFQELCLSPRLLIFTQHSVQWLCHCSEWVENVFEPQPTNLHYEPRGDLALEVDTLPNIFRWMDLIDDYSERKLSFSSDAYAAFSGVEKLLELSFPGGFCYGLPEFFFDAALLWQPGEVLQRREAIDTRFNQYQLPSWSWVGWEGKLQMVVSCIPATHYFHPSNTESFSRVGDIDWEVEPLVAWSQKGSSTGEQRPIRNDYHLWRARGETTSDLPAGWKFNRDGEGEYFTHFSAPRTHLRYPLPTVAELPPREDSSWPPYLRFRSFRAFLRLQRAIELNWYGNSFLETMSIILVDNEGRSAGILRLNLECSDIAPIGQVCELVALSKGRAQLTGEDPDPCPNRVEELFLDEIPKQDGVYRFYNVLCVKWEGDHILREAAGRVEASIWEQQDLEEMDFELH